MPMARLPGRTPVPYLPGSPIRSEPKKRARQAVAKKLEGKIAVVTGGSAGIGFSTAQHFIAEGAKVFITGRRQTELDKAAKELGPNAISLQGNVANLADLDRIFARVKADAGRLDILMANAAFFELGKLGEISEEHFDKTFGTNVRGALFTVQKALPLLSEGASVILIGSIGAQMGMEAFSVYTATKAAIRAFARGWIVDLKSRKIRVNVLSPGHTDTPGLNGLLNSDQKAYLAGQTPLGRLGTGDDVARAAVFLASDDSAFITGSELFVDGGTGQI
jgi:NAD(P)-dependent dehydrogenase (short-subunit alcohol dehydrogenase family)